MMERISRILFAVLLSLIAPSAIWAQIWTTEPWSYPDTLFGVCVVDEQHSWAVGKGRAPGIQGVVARRDELGWHDVTNLPNQDQYFYTGVFFLDNQMGWVVGHQKDGDYQYKGTIVKTTDGGLSWEEQTDISWPVEHAPIDCTPFLDVSFSDADADYGYIGAGNGYVLTTTDGGTHWVARKMMYDPDLWKRFFTQWFWGVWADPADRENAWVCADGEGFVLKTSDGGVSWNFLDAEARPFDWYYNPGPPEIGPFDGYLLNSDIWCKDFSHPIVPLSFGYAGYIEDTGWGKWVLGNYWLWLYGTGGCVHPSEGSYGWVCGIGTEIWRYGWPGSHTPGWVREREGGANYHLYDVDVIDYLNEGWGNAVGAEGAIFKRRGPLAGSGGGEGGAGAPPHQGPGQVQGLTGQYLASPICAVRLDWTPNPSGDLVGGYWVCPQGGGEKYSLCHSAPVPRVMCLYGRQAGGGQVGFAVCAMDRGGEFGPWSDLIWVNTCSFANPTILEATACGNAERLLRDASGCLHTAYATETSVLSGEPVPYVRYRYSSDDGYNWSQEEGIGEGEYPSLGLETTANPNACWRRNTSTESIIYFSRRLGGDAGWTTPCELLHGYSNPPTSTVYSVPAHRVDNSNIVHVVVEKTSLISTVCSWQLLYGTFPVADPANAQWETIDSQSPYYYPWSGSQASPSIDLDSDGNPYVCWSRGGEIYAATRDGGSWPTMNVSESPGYDSKDCSIELESGTAHFVWAEERTPGQADYDIFHRAYRYFPPPQDWVTVVPENISNSATSSEAPVYCAGCVSWHEETGDWTDVYFAASGEGSWTVPKNKSECDWADSRFPQMVYVGVDPPQVPHIDLIWTEGREPRCMIPIERVEVSGSPAGGGQCAGDFRLPKVFSLAQNSPNPLSSRTRIQYGVATPCRVKLSVYDAVGRLVRTLVARKEEPGHYTTTWNARDAAGGRVTPGVYFCRLETRSFTATNKMVVLR